jgi:hypothetical protein
MLRVAATWTRMTDFDRCLGIVWTPEDFRICLVWFHIILRRSA